LDPLRIDVIANAAATVAFGGSDQDAGVTAAKVDERFPGPRRGQGEQSLGGFRRRRYEDDIRLARCFFLFERCGPRRGFVFRTALIL
jgi:hypothetical protein